jgi:putative ABC transport system permease protein
MRPVRGALVRHLLAESWCTARSQPRRSLLAGLSIAWGIATFVLLLAYGDNVSRTVIQAFYAYGPDAILITPGRTVLQAGGLKAGRVLRFTLGDIDYLQQAVPTIGRISPEARRPLDFSAGTRIRRSTLTGVWPEYGSVRDLQLEAGRWLTPDDEVRRARVVVLAADLKERLFGAAPAVGQTVQVMRAQFTVVGVLRRKAQRVVDAGENDQAFTPLAALSSVAAATRLSAIVLAPEIPPLRVQCVEQVRQALAARHRFHPTDPLAIRVWDVRKAVEEGLEVAMRGLQWLVAFIGLLTLAVGGVGITNIMLVSVVARTREVGMIKSLGARRRDIFIQFLGESVILVLTGGAAGIGLAYLAGWLAGPMPLWSAFAQQRPDVGQVSLHISLWHVGVAWVALGLVGVASGLWPAWRAAALDPVEALRRE